ncbi:RNA 2',3'-cyclic phosphodiesterase [Solirubrobacter sp. CPCC 204708]|uniref:RNA 2',3'-cyclic phosphodiesterase n=1 Tax=Solirubrobacter deserti TaxID=2282478 RepID=A0ABT4RH34_9ACTN|nr:RNA 2',3'-cyclic phosphodiesterase [Solirubrobacter deserti]MBE2315324.1 RNA 2',3'-cyclic phosphodiesterase [Solirubrobacter deserti]MDA0137831.1 RNA 2',3'-cyclic phosphodiesterase [Solirubrobacter deserti]
MPAVLRLFVALDLPNELRATLAALRIDESTWRPIPEEALHITLAFLGARPPTDVDLIRPIIEAERAAPELVIGNVLLLPPRRARVLTVELEDPTNALRELQARVSHGLEQAGVHTPEKRPFRAHVTVARMRPRVTPPREVPLDLEPTRFHGRSLTLYRSQLHPSGASYHALISQPLGYIQP